MMQNDDTGIRDFRGENEFLTNGFPSAIIVDGELYPSVEHAFQACKTDDPDLKKKIRDALSPRDAKKLGRSAILVQDWDQKRIDVMASLIKQKFTEHPDLKMKLLLTGKKELIQGNTKKDHFWGQDQDGIGENNLGKILMAIRDQIRATEGGAFQVLLTFLEKHNLQDIGKSLDFLLNLVTGVKDNVDPSGLVQILTPHDEIVKVVDSLK